MEGYGCTEMSPVVAVNAPDFSAGRDTQTGSKPGTVGHPLPGVAARIVDPATFDPLPPNTEGLLLVKGSNRMLGYLNQPARTADVFRDDWYITGDIALIDDEGFIRPPPPLAIQQGRRRDGAASENEEAILAILGDAPSGYRHTDDIRGERLVALYVNPEVTPAVLWQRLSETDLPKLWLPKRENLYPVDALPQLGTGKLDLRGVKLRAQILAGVNA